MKCCLLLFLSFSLSLFAYSNNTSDELVISNDTIYVSGVPVATMLVEKSINLNSYSFYSMAGEEIIFLRPEKITRKAAPPAYQNKYTPNRTTEDVWYYEILFPQYQLKAELELKDIKFVPLRKREKNEFNMVSFLVKNKLLSKEGLDEKVAEAFVFKYGNKYSEEKEQNSRPSIIIIKE